METFSALLAICAGNSPVSGEFPAQRPVTRSSDVCFDLRLNEWLSKHSWGWRLETLSRRLWRHSNALDRLSCNVNTCVPWTLMVWRSNGLGHHNSGIDLILVAYSLFNNKGLTLLCLKLLMRDTITGDNITNRNPKIQSVIKLCTRITVTSKWARWRLKCTASWLLAQPFVQAQIKENIKATRHWPLRGETTGDRWISLTKGQ